MLLSVADFPSLDLRGQLLQVLHRVGHASAPALVVLADRVALSWRSAYRARTRFPGVFMFMFMFM